MLPLNLRMAVTGKGQFPRLRIFYLYLHLQYWATYFCPSQVYIKNKERKHAIGKLARREKARFSERKVSRPARTHSMKAIESQYEYKGIDVTELICFGEVDQHGKHSIIALSLCVYSKVFGKKLKHE